MSDSIVIMTPRPGRIEEIIPVALDRPRDRSSPEFLAPRARILKKLHFAGHASEGTSLPPGRTHRRTQPPP